jgi:hypothetical protein
LSQPDFRGFIRLSRPDFLGFVRLSRQFGSRIFSLDRFGGAGVSVTSFGLVDPFEADVNWNADD